MRNTFLLLIFILNSACSTITDKNGTSNDYVRITGGEYRPLYISKNSPKEKVGTFYLDISPVTNQQFYEFVNRYPQWKKENIATLFSEDLYLNHWYQSQDTWKPLKENLNAPIIYVSWFAAQAFCQSKGKRLPLVAEWEYTGMASETRADGSKEEAYNRLILNWYGRPVTDKEAMLGMTKANYWGVKDMHGIVWEWTEDFNSALVNGDSRNDGTIDTTLFCGAGAAGVTDPSNYAAFMRFGFRSSLQAKFTLPSLGFRCAKSVSL